MSWDPIWEKIFRERNTWGKYPSEALIRFIARHYYSSSNRKKLRFLELGSGPGSGSGWYLSREGFSYFGYDASFTALSKGKKRIQEEGLSGTFVRGAFEHLPWQDESFDCVIEVASLQCNAEADTRTIIKEIYRVLKIGGRHFSFTAMDNCYGDGPGDRIDPLTLRNVEEGPFANMGVTRFSDRENLEELYRGFQNLEIGYCIRSLEDSGKEMRHWFLTCLKSAQFIY